MKCKNEETSLAFAIVQPKGEEQAKKSNIVLNSFGFENNRTHKNINDGSSSSNSSSSNSSSSNSSSNNCDVKILFDFNNSYGFSFGKPPSHAESKSAEVHPSQSLSQLPFFSARYPFHSSSFLQLPPTFALPGKGATTSPVGDSSITCKRSFLRTEELRVSPAGIEEKIQRKEPRAPSDDMIA